MSQLNNVRATNKVRGRSSRDRPSLGLGTRLLSYRPSSIDDIVSMLAWLRDSAEQWHAGMKTSM